MDKHLIETKNITKSYGSNEALVYALKDVSMHIDKGEFVVILGSSGSGKSTLLNMLGGIDYVESGSILFNGEDITKFNDNKLTEYRKNNIGFVFQFFNLLNDLNVYQNLLITPSKTTISNDKINKCLNAVGILDKKDKYPKMLSGGQQQRVSIARALVKDCDLLLCDEPTGALDYQSGKDVLKVLEEVNKAGKTIVLVTHTKEIANMADRVIQMRNGQIINEYKNENKLSASEVDW